MAAWQQTQRRTPVMRPLLAWAKRKPPAVGAHRLRLPGTSTGGQVLFGLKMPDSKFGSWRASP